LEGKFSLAYNVAGALADGEVTVNTFTDASLERLAAYRSRVAVYPTAQLPQNGARVKIVASDGRIFEREQLILRGSLEDPMPMVELERKFRANVAGRISGDAVAEALSSIADLAEQKNLATLSDALLG
jgi:2-methylcitrate dehydratase PrpD